MSRRPDPHLRFHELLAARLDEPLEAADTAALQVHLAACAACRSVDKAYRRQREQLRALAPVPPPRDLWARTSAALDREMVRRPLPAPHDLDRGRRRSAGLTAAALLSLGVTTVLVGSQLTPAGPVAVAATPFSVPPTTLAIVGAGPDGLTIYRAQVDEVCPSGQIDCIGNGTGAKPVAHLAGRIAADSAVADPLGDRLAIHGLDELGRSFIAVLDIAASDNGGNATPTPIPTGDAAPSAPTGPTPTPPASRPPQSALPSTGAPASEPPVTERPTERPTDPVATDSASEPPTSQPSAEPSASSITPPPSPTLPSISARPILTDVIPAGMPAAWSADGGTLAFSARPVDGSTGPDVYLWRPGEETARPITSDHRSYFASWLGPQVVISRPLQAEGSAGPNRSADATASLAASTAAQVVVHDPAAGTVRVLEGADAWLPVVDPAGRFVLFWRGELVTDGVIAQPLRGDLYLAPWSALDPEAQPPDAGPSASPDGTAKGTAPSPARAGRDPRSGRVTPSPPAPLEDDEQDEPTADDGGAIRLTGRAAAGRGAVLDWLLRWSADGAAYAIWIAEAPGAALGRLSVTDVASAGGGIRTETLLEPVRARRAFSIGLDRVAWVAAGEEGAGDLDELRVVTWGPGGPGVVRIRDVDGGRGVPAF
ncbi:MAG TPA: zf-HC2 domain-containing protein [Candidatus Limnocylindrales bacterium]|nr:zf-HC2 domain-containing protein [Candidatus Limnocylindrales bacterium]